MKKPDPPHHETGTGGDRHGAEQNSRSENHPLVVRRECQHGVGQATQRQAAGGIGGETLRYNAPRTKRCIPLARMANSYRPSQGAQNLKWVTESKVPEA